MSGESDQEKKIDLSDKLVYSNSLGGYILDVPEELKDKILVNHFGGQGGQTFFAQEDDCGGLATKFDPCANLCSGGQMICESFLLLRKGIN